MTSITEKMEQWLQNNKLRERIYSFLKNNNAYEILKSSGAYKSKGIPIMQMMTYLVQLVFTNKSMYMNILSGTNNTGFSKDVIYRFLNSPYINWCKYLLRFALSVIKPIREASSAERLCAMIIDDSMFERLRSKKVELLANVHDHAAKTRDKYKRGFRLLTLAWTDGVSLIPLMFRHMSSKDKKNRHQEINPDIDKRSVGYKARLQAVSTSVTVMFDMLKQAKLYKIPAKHVLFDSWFSFPSNIISINEIGFHVVSRLKDSVKIKYLYNGAKHTLREIYAANKKRPGLSKYLLSVSVRLYNDEGKTVPARIVFVRDRNNKKKWIAFVSTDLTLSEEDVIKLYGKRWDIEVFFKMCKSYLKLSKEFQGLSYDCITAHTAIVMTRYVLLAVDKRQNEDARTFGELFFSCYDEVMDKTFSEIMTVILAVLHEALLDCLFLSDSEIKALIDIFISKTSSVFRDSLVKNNVSLDVA